MDLPDILSPGMTLGAVCIGAMVAAILFGITTLQAGMYYKNYSDDWWVYRYSVASLWILDALHIALSTHALYYYLIRNFTAINHVVWCFKLQILFDVLIIMAVQVLYTFRLWKLDQSYYTVVLCFVILAVIATFTGSGIYVIVHIYSLSNFLSVENIKKFISIAVSAAAGSESAIAVSMCYYLHKSRSVLNFTSTSSKLVNLMCLVCMLIAFPHYGMASFSVVPDANILPQFFIWPHSIIFIGIDFILPKPLLLNLTALQGPPPVVVLSLAASQPLIYASMIIYTPIYAGFRLTTILRSLPHSVLHLRFTFKSVGKRTEGKALDSAAM
ncbi:hypothetical protein EDD18DRAFT_1360421 [Armillaria luteobubalina]|uniref:Uncharacterized protein n=1 Tax=Armillaria luteobubalina TaxID=153913 RepID=A0AA39TFW5_9AGAR|nr:hypothetical protein EDD18DRAFT_1360421 [Armillaria luteobubalina]